MTRKGNRPGAPSLWIAMAGAAPSADAPVSTGAPIERDLSVELAVIGSGYSGLSAAHALQCGLPVDTEFAVRSM
jgi:hypothetical protein